MDQQKRYVLITRSSLGALDSSWQRPKKLEFDCDCACGDDGFVPSGMTLPPPAPGTRFLSGSLFTARLTGDLHLAFDSRHRDLGVVVLNRPTRNLLQAFASPRTLQEGADLVDKHPEALRTARELVALGLLTPAGTTPTPSPFDNQPQTLTAWLHVSNQCNLRCDYCYVNKTPDEMELATGREAINAIFRSATNNNFRKVKIKYAGGEASLNFPLVLALQQHAQSLAAQHNLALDSVILSNGVAWSSRMIAALKAHDLRLMISLDGIGEFHDRQRQFSSGHGSFTHVERTLDRLAVAGVVPSISITVSNRNLAGLPQVLDYVLQRQLPFTLNFFRENECAVSFTDLTYQDEAIIAAMQAAFAVIEANLPPHSLLGALVDRARLDTMHNRTCGVGQSYLVIDQNGGIAKCHMEIEQTVTDIQAADPLQLIRLDQVGIQNLPAEEKEGCRDCEWQYWCAGGCPALTYRATGRFDIKSPNCRIYKALFPEVLRLEGLRLLKYSGIPVA